MCPTRSRRSLGQAKTRPFFAQRAKLAGWLGCCGDRADGVDGAICLTRGFVNAPIAATPSSAAGSI